MPTLNLQVAASADDAEEKDDGTGFGSTATTEFLQANANAANRSNLGFRFTNVTIPQGSTIDTATLQLYCDDSTGKYDDIRCDVLAEDVDNAVDFSTDPDVTSRVRTTASVLWAQDNCAVGWESAPDIKTVVQEVTDRGGWASGNAFVILCDGRDDSTKNFSARMRDYGATTAAKLDITYTVATGRASRSYPRGVARGMRRGII